MVERRVCTFCGQEIEPGTGRMYVKKDGVVYQFCTSKCYKNLVELKRVPRRTTWTSWYTREKQVRMKGAEPEPAPSKARKVRKRAEPKKESVEEKPAPEIAEETVAPEAGPEDEKGDAE
jgi:large subunit ribosomal protein L24e